MSGVDQTTPAKDARPKAPGIRCTCSKAIPFSWATKLIQGEQGDTYELECFKCGALWHVSQERAPGGKPAEPERKIPILIRIREDNTLDEVLYRGKPAKLGVDYTIE